MPQDRSDHENGPRRKKRKHDVKESPLSPIKTHDTNGSGFRGEAEKANAHSTNGQKRAAVPAYTHRPLDPESTLPDLPPVHDEKLLSAVFTHRGVLDAEGSLCFDRCYDRYEFLGDAYLEVIATRIIFDLFPNLPSGRLSEIREDLINNTTLGGYAVAYGFEQKALVPKPAVAQIKNSHKVNADLFEAYVAAIILSSPGDGFATAETWLGRLWATRLAKFEDDSTASANAKQDLAKKIGGKEVTIAYVQERRPEPISKSRTAYFMRVELTGWGWHGQRLGSGTGTSKAMAGSRAALAALDNVPLIDEIAVVKQLFDAETKRKREQEQSKEHG
ncbi:MAG: hypothetical protein M1837_001564 [Sclerophora amabilis]|nr:MAG: hypothetical protein M1837_001564 [Sclerophora amabilis]